MYRVRSLVLALVGALSVGLVYAEQSKETDKGKQAEKEKTERQAESDFNLFALSFGEGGYLGVYLEEVTPDRVRELALKEERGAIVMKVIAGGPAEKGGFKQNDVILSFNGRRVDTVRELQRMLGETLAGRTVTVEVLRGGAAQTLTATLGKRSDSFELLGQQRRLEAELKRSAAVLEKSQEAMKRAQEEMGKQVQEWGDFNFVTPGRFSVFRGGRLGVTIESLTPQLAEYFGVKEGHGALVTEVRENMPGAKAGLKAGDVITAIDGKKVDDVDSVVNSIAAKEEGPVSLLVIRNRKEQAVTVTLEKRPAPPRPARRVSRTRAV